MVRSPSDEVDAVVGEWTRERPDVDAASIGIFGRLGRLHVVARGIVPTFTTAMV